jgi:hypothetical protein
MLPEINGARDTIAHLPLRHRSIFFKRQFKERGVEIEQ